MVFQFSWQKISKKLLNEFLDIKWTFGTVCSAPQYIKIGSCVWLQINDQHLIGFQSLKTAGHNFNGNIWTTYTFALRLFVILREIKDSEKYISFMHSGFRWEAQVDLPI